jgi:hypothetical protein
MRSIFLSLFFFLILKLGAQQWNGHTLISVYGQTSALLVDTNGATVHTWTFTSPNGYSSYMVPGGSIYRTVPVPPLVTPSIAGMTGQIQKVDYAGNVLWQYDYNSPQGILHHDFVVLPNGNVVLTAYDVRTGTAIPAAGSTSTETMLYSERLIELQPVGTNSANIVWEWKMWDHLVQNTNSLVSNYYSSIVNHPELFDINYIPQADFVHMNGVDYNPVLDQIVFSSRYRSEWYVIDHSTSTSQAASHAGGYAGKGGDILYRWGNPTVYQAAAPQICFVTHDPHWILEGVPNAGSLVGYNNGGQQSPTLLSTIDRVVPPRTNYNYSITPGSAFTPTIYNSRYVSTAYNIITGCSEQYPNGNQSICLGTSGVVYEIDPSGNVLWSYSTGGITPQAHRYSPCYTSSVALTQPSISVSGPSLVSTSAASYQWYCNGNAIAGATTQAITGVFGQNGNYLVRVMDANGCAKYYSQGIYFTPSPVGLKEMNAASSNIQVYPNPGHGIFYLSTEDLSGKYSVEVFSSDGRTVMKEENTKEIDLSKRENGIYLVLFSSEKFRVCKKIVLEK